MPRRTAKEYLAAAYHTLVKLAEREIEQGKLRDELTDGALYEVAGHVEVRVDGEAVRARFCGPLTVGHAQVSATSSVPKLPHVVAAILGRLTAPQRGKVYRELVKSFQDAGGVLPEPQAELVEQAEALLADLRTTQQISKRGPVRCEAKVER